MDNKKICELIYDLRKVKRMTQKQLGEKLNVTDKAVSKWERGHGYPEITIIPELAKVLGVTVNELLSGEKNIIKPIELKEDEVVNNTIKYIERVKKFNALNIFFIISIFFLIGMFVCLLCDFAINRSFHWSLYPTASLLLVWIIIIPVFFMKKHRVFVATVIITVALIPYLFLVEYLSPVKGWLIPMAIPITVVSLIACFIGIKLFLYTKINRYYIIAINCILFGVIVNLSINHIVYNYVKEKENNISVVITAISFVFIGFFIFIMGQVKETKDVLKQFHTRLSLNIQ